MKSILHKVFQHPVVRLKPPVLIDIGASGALPEQWRLIAPYSICVAFDADTRDFSVDASIDKGYMKLYSLNRLVGAASLSEVPFYLTRSPYCSSSLRPDNHALEPWAFQRLFDVERTVKMLTVNLISALEGCGIDYVDWYKTDSQGTDLRIFGVLPQTVIKHAIVVEFEPGIIDAYIGEDKLHQLMAFMDMQPFWVSSMVIKGSQRIDQKDLSSLNLLQRIYPDLFIKTAPGWCEISYINKFSIEDMGLREYLLGWVFSSIKGEHGFALHLARYAAEKFHDPLVDELIETSRNALSGGYLVFAKRLMKKAACIIFGETR